MSKQLPEVSDAKIQRIAEIIAGQVRSLEEREAKKGDSNANQHA